MAFKMNRSIVKGTSGHKTSMAKAKAKKAIVAQTRTKANPALIEAARFLGESRGVKPIEFGLKQRAMKFFGDHDDTKKKKKKYRTSESKDTDYGTYDEYVADHMAEKERMSDSDKEAYGDPLSKEEWTELNVEAGMEKPKEERRQIETPISIPPIQPVSTIETGEISDELERPTVDLVESESEDFFDAAERFGFPMETEEDYNEFEAFANDNLEFSDTTKKWELTEEAKNRVVTPITPQQITELPPQIDPIQKPEILRPYEGEVDTTEHQEDKFVTAAQDILGVDLYGEWENIKADETLSEQERNEKMTNLLERTENRMVYDEESDTYREKVGGVTFDPEDQLEIGTYYVDDEYYDELLDEDQIHGPNLPETDKPKQIPFMKKVSFEKYDKIFENAIKGGALQKNLLKRGYIPQNLR